MWFFTRYPPYHPRAVYNGAARRTVYSSLQMARTKSVPKPTNSLASKLPSFYSNSVALQSACYDALQNEPHCDIVALLAQSQTHNVDIIPLTWLPRLESVGFGGTAEISQSLVNAHMSLAFKRILRADDDSLSESKAYRVLISEVCILSQSPIRGHPNIVQLQGLCFEIPSGETAVWPVLIFEKAKFGNLREFMETKVGLGLSFDQRLDMIHQIAAAIAMLHSSSET
jgi:hypothetical protein